jgi:hypothetical protein
VIDLEDIPSDFIARYKDRFFAHRVYERDVVAILNAAIEAGLVARILPDPVEEREKWRATCGHVTTYGSEIQVRTWADWQNGPVTIEHVRETVLSREEVKSE